ncbi:MAG: hypothetical protein QOJ25_1067 [Solirubrobacteraceae bacterium]|jgi:hypothetical protein|nr:hypothetical protein [Solirubrobacteraceae bacterium]
MLSYPQDAVEALIAEGTPLDEIEERIDELPLDAEQRSALWLLAWVKVTNPATRTRITADGRPWLE